MVPGPDLTGQRRVRATPLRQPARRLRRWSATRPVPVRCRSDRRRDGGFATVSAVDAAARDARRGGLAGAAETESEGSRDAVALRAGRGGSAAGAAGAAPQGKADEL